MAGISRRNVLSGGLALSASSILARNAWARTAAAFSHFDDPSAATPAIAPREQLLFDFDWKFTLLSHNVIRGAAGAAVLNAEILAMLGKLDWKKLLRDFWNAFAENVDRDLTKC